jgi:hypothetical protein
MTNSSQSLVIECTPSAFRQSVISLPDEKFSARAFINSFLPVIHYAGKLISKPFWVYIPEAKKGQKLPQQPEIYVDRLPSKIDRFLCASQVFKSGFSDSKERLSSSIHSDRLINGNCSAKVMPKPCAPKKNRYNVGKCQEVS